MTTSKLYAALRSKYGTPRAVLVRLGLDENLLAPAASSGINTDPVLALRLDIESLLGELNLDDKQIGRILEVLDRHASFDRLSGDGLEGRPQNPIAEGAIGGRLADQTSAQAMDRSFQRRFPDAARIVAEPVRREARRLLAADAAPSRAQIEQFNRKYPDAARIVT